MGMMEIPMWGGPAKGPRNPVAGAQPVQNPLGVMQMAGLGGAAPSAPMGGEGGAQSVNTTQVAQTGGLGQAPRTGAAPVTTPPRFSNADIDFMAAAIDPEMAAALGFGIVGRARTGEGFFDRYRKYYDQQGSSGAAPGTFPTDWNTDDFRQFFLHPDANLHELYDQVPAYEDHPSAEASVRFLDYLSGIMEKVQSGKLDPKTLQPTAGNEPTQPPGSAPPGSYGEDERNAFRRPLTKQEQNWFDYVQAATTGRGPIDPNVQAGVKFAMDADLAAGRTPNVAAYVKRIADAQHSNPGTYLYDASRGKLPDEIANMIQERTLQGMGNVGARYGSGTAAAVGRGLAEASQTRALEAQKQVSAAQGQVALMEANREQAAQSALYAQYLRNLGLPPELTQLLSLLNLNTGGGTQTTSGSGAPGAGWDIASSLLGAGGQLAGAYSNYYKTNPPGSTPNNQIIPTILSPDYYNQP